MSSWKVIWHLRTLCSAEPMNGFHREGYSVQWSGHYVLNAEVSGFQVGIQNLTMQTAWHLLLCPLLLIFIVLWNEFGLGFSLEWFHLIYWFHSLLYELRSAWMVQGPCSRNDFHLFFTFSASMPQWIFPLYTVFNLLCWTILVLFLWLGIVIMRWTVETWLV